MACMFYLARCMNIIYNSLLALLIKYDVDTTRKIKSIHAIFYHILLFYSFLFVLLLSVFRNCWLQWCQ